MKEIASLWMHPGKLGVALLEQAAQFTMAHIDTEQPDALYKKKMLQNEPRVINITQ